MRGVINKKDCPIFRPVFCVLNTNKSTDIMGFHVCRFINKKIINLKSPKLYKINVMRKSLFTLSMLLACCLTGFAQDDERILSSNPALYYSFEKDDYKTPTVGNIPLEYYKAGASNTIGTPWVEGDPQPIPILGPTLTKKAVIIPTELFIKVANPISSEEGLSTFTLLFDIQCPDFSNYRAFLQANKENTSDAIFFANKSGALGVSSYSDFVLRPAIYYRVVLACGGGKYNVYVNGNLEVSLDRSVGLLDFFWLFTDNDGENIETICANIAFWSTTLTAEDIAALGGIETIPYDGTPYGETIPVAPNNIIEAEFFDEGISGMTYFVADQSAGGDNNSIRQDVGLPIRTDDENGDYIILKNREFAVYTIGVEKTDSYVFLFNSKGVAAEGKVSVFMDNVAVNNVAVQSNEDWNYLELLGTLDEGQHLLKIRYDGTGEFHFADLFVDLATSVDLTPTYYYDFEDPTDLAKPIVGDVPLGFYNTADRETPNASGIQVAEGPKDGDAAVFVDPTAVFKVNNPFFSDENRLAVYTILWDVKLLEMNDYNSFVQFGSPTSDGDLFVRSEARGGIGVGSLGYSPNGATTTIHLDTWSRLVFTSDVTSDGQTKKIYLNGEEIHQANVDIESTRFTIGEYFWIFADESGERMPLNCSKFIFWANRALNKVDLAKAGLGGNPTAIKKVETLAGKVYAENGKLHVEGFSASASVEVYNLVGQKVTAVKSLNGNTVNVSAKGINIVRVTDKGKSYSYKILVK
jgi:hypothetical protein